MPYRKEALWRLLGLVYLVTIWPVVMAVGLLAAVAYMVVDVAIQLGRGTEGLSTATGGWHATLLRLYYYGLNQAQWVLFGADEFPIVP